jgi:hypothetical protein
MFAGGAHLQRLVVKLRQVREELNGASGLLSRHERLALQPRNHALVVELHRLGHRHAATGRAASRRAARSSAAGSSSSGRRLRRPRRSLRR